MEPIRNCPDLMEAIQKIGLVPLLDSGIPGFSADELVAPECRYVMTDDGWDWPLWDWKGPMVTEGHFAYGKFFNGKAGFVTMETGGPTSATTAAPSIRNLRRTASRAPSSKSSASTAA